MFSGCFAASATCDSLIILFIICCSYFSLSNASILCFTERTRNKFISVDLLRETKDLYTKFTFRDA